MRLGHDGQIVLELLGEAKPYMLHVQADIICKFLDATEAIAPTGDEADNAVIDALINRLLEY